MVSTTTVTATQVSIAIAPIQPVSSPINGTLIHSDVNGSPICRPMKLVFQTQVNS